MNKFLKILSEQKDLFLYVLCAILSLLSITFENANSRNAVATALMSVTGSIQNFGSRIGTFLDETVNSIAELTRLKQEYEALSVELESYRTQIQSIRELQTENSALRTTLEFAEASSPSLIAAEIIAKTPGSFSDEFVLNKGSSTSIAKNDPVVAMVGGERVLVGKVIEVTEQQSVVLPVFSQSTYVAGRLRDQRFEGLVNGRGNSGGANLVMEFVDRQARTVVSVGDVVISSGLDSLYPRGLTIGTVQGIEAQPWETSIRLLVQSAVPFARLEYVFVWKGGEED